MVDRLGEMRKGRRKGIEKWSRERIIEKRERDKKTIRREGGPKGLPFYNFFCFFKSSGQEKLELKHQNLVFMSL